MTEMKIPKKLIEVALPLDDINAAATREKSIRHGHPSGLHQWWARRPLAAARAVLFAQLVNDPGYQRELGFGINKKEAEIKREKLFDIIRDLVKWENTTNEEVLIRAREAILESWREVCHLNRGHPQAAELFNPENLPATHDPFAGGGAIPLEAQRLGLESYATDLNPVAVTINKAMIEIPPKFIGQMPVGPIPKDERYRGSYADDWSGARGLAEDVRRFGHWMREEAIKRIGHIYPKVKITKSMTLDRPDLNIYEGNDLTILSWIWAKTVKSQSPVYNDISVPLVSNFILSNKKGKEVYVNPMIEGNSYRFEVKNGKPPPEARSGTKAGRGGNFTCIISGTPIPVKTIRAEGQAGRIGKRLLAVVAEGKRGRVYLSPTSQFEDIFYDIDDQWKPNIEIFEKALGYSVGNYGLTTWGDFFTTRQLISLNTFSNLIQEVRKNATNAAKSAGRIDDGIGLESGGVGASAYGDAVAVYLAFALDKMADLGNVLCRWESTAQCPRQLFSSQAIPMVWDFAEANPLSSSSGSWIVIVEGISKSFAKCFSETKPWFRGLAMQSDAANQIISKDKIISTDPPYYDNIGYADLSDFFYVWMRRSLREVYPSLFSTMAVPKAEELVATPFRNGSKEGADKFFMDGMTCAIHNMAEQSHPAFPVAIYYAFKQSETKEGSTTSKGWVAFLEAVIRAGFSIDGTWPLNTENASRVRGQDSNALASSIVLVCRKRHIYSETTSRREFQRRLREDMPEALETMTGGETGQTPIAPVDLAQAAIGPGMAIFSKYEAVLNQDGSRMSVHDALILINRSITDYLSPDAGNFDSETQFCSSWFEQYGWSAGPFGEADTLSRAKGTSVDGIGEIGILESGGGKVRLLKWSEYELSCDMMKSILPPPPPPIWKSCHSIVWLLKTQGESAAGELLAKIPEKGESIRQLAYHLYTLCERKKWAEDARAYNELIASWHAIVSASYEAGHHGTQTEFGLGS